MKPQALKFLQRCTVRVGASGSGSGFFVAPNKILSCAHVVGSQNQTIEILWRQEYNNSFESLVSEVEYFNDEPHVDLALLKLTRNIRNHPTVHFDLSTPSLDESLYCYGYPQSYLEGDSVTFKYEGESVKNGSIIYKLKEGHADYGLSGSPLLSLRTSGVCGIISISRDTSSDLGARAIPGSLILSKITALAEIHRIYPKGNLEWQSFFTSTSSGDLSLNEVLSCIKQAHLMIEGLRITETQVEITHEILGQAIDLISSKLSIARSQNNYKVSVFINKMLTNISRTRIQLKALGEASFGVIDERTDLKSLERINLQLISVCKELEEFNNR